MDTLTPTTPEEIAFARYERILKIAFFAALIFFAGMAIGQGRVETPNVMGEAMLKFAEASSDQFHAWVRDPANRPVVAQIGGWDNGLTVVPGTSSWELCRLAGACLK